jgi:anti-sigma regulatory factor (Ser/Thr protein kinase)
LDNISESKQSRIKACVARIKDTIRVLSEKKNALPNSMGAIDAPVTKVTNESTLVAPIIEAIVNEKKEQYRNHVRLSISFESTDEGLFSVIRFLGNDLSRALSNIIDNAVQAMPAQTGKIRVKLFTENGQNVIAIEDNGKGIPTDLITQLGKRGATFGKEGGSGLGLWHAKQVAEQAGGTLRIASEAGKGTEIRLVLPQVPSPSWLASQLNLTPGQFVVVLDDDPTILQMWAQKLGAPDSDKVRLVLISSGREFYEWFHNHPHEQDTALFLCDFELHGESETGLDIIDKCSIQNRSLCVTSHHQNPRVRERARALGVKLVPKEISGFIPVRWVQP